MENSKIKEKYGAGRYLILFFALAAIGWIFESSYVTLRTGIIHNSGFLNMPVCPIYAVAILSAYLLVGTPEDGRGIFKGLRKKPVRYALYFAVAFLLPSFAELFVGGLFERTLGLTLWSYEGIPLSFKYASAPISLAWSGLLFFFMKTWFTPLKNAIGKIPQAAVYIVGAVLVVFLGVDLLISVSPWL